MRSQLTVAQPLPTNCSIILYSSSHTLFDNSYQLDAGNSLGFFHQSYTFRTLHCAFSELIISTLLYHLRRFITYLRRTATVRGRSVYPALAQRLAYVYDKQPSSGALTVVTQVGCSALVWTVFHRLHIVVESRRRILSLNVYHSTISQLVLATYFTRCRTLLRKKPNSSHTLSPVYATRAFLSYRRETKEY